MQQKYCKNLTRRDFIKITVSSLGAAGLLGYGLPVLANTETKLKLRTDKSTEIPSVCGLCSVGCGIIYSVSNGQLINIEGDPDHPINRGTLCAKGQTQSNLINVLTKKGKSKINPARNTKVLYRAKGSAKWVEKDWDWAIDEIAKRVKATRDKYFITAEGQGAVNRNEAIASLGGAMQTNEECYLIQKLARSLGIVYLDNEDSLCQSPINNALTASFGRSGATNHLIDIQNSDVVMAIGSNIAQNNAVAMKWVQSAKDNGAKFINIDPRYCQTSIAADIYAPIRQGTDIAFLGGLINYIITNELYDKAYLAAYTDAAHLIDTGYSFDDGIFVGYDKATRSYDKSHWHYRLQAPAVGPEGEAIPGAKSQTAADFSLADESTVFGSIKKHYSRYSPDIVSDITGMPKKLFLEIASAFTEASQGTRAGTMILGAGLTQHATGTQAVRAALIIQLLLGNIGIAGGGITGPGGSANAQGALNQGLGPDVLPGEISLPVAAKHPDIFAYLGDNDKRHSVRSDEFISLLKAYYGDYASGDNTYAYDLLPKRRPDADYSTSSMFEVMQSGSIKGLFVWGQNPVVTTPNANEVIDGMSQLEWLVVTDLWITETAQFWLADAKTGTKTDTEVFLLPSASYLEKDGSITNSSRWIQWNAKVQEPLKGTRTDLWIVNRIYKAVARLYEQEKGKVPEAILKLHWDYNDKEPDAVLVASEMNGFNINTKKPLSGNRDIRGDGTIMCGNRLYAGFFNTTKAKTAQAPLARRDDSDSSGIGLFSGWSYSWPDNIRILYTQAFATPAGLARLWVDTMADGPLPEHYEPMESPGENLLSSAQSNPVSVIPASARLTKPGSREFPILMTTFHTGTQVQSGQASRNMPWLFEVAPGAFLVEIGKQLANDYKIKTGDDIIIFNNRGSIEAKALVTQRIKPFKVGNKVVHHIAAPICSGSLDKTTAMTANSLTINIKDPNSSAMEYKSFLVEIRKGAD